MGRLRRQQDRESPRHAKREVDGSGMGVMVYNQRSPIFVELEDVLSSFQIIF